MSYVQSPINDKKNFPLVLSVLDSPALFQLKELASPSSQYTVYEYPKRKISLVAYKLTIPKSRLLTNLQIYQWRSQTQFPIVKTIFVEIKQNYSPSQIVEATVYNEYCPLKLTQIQQISISQTIYLLKQSIIGFQRLFTRFGPFQITESMVTINQKGFCKVWFAENLAINNFPKRQINQSKMVNKIFSILEPHSQQSKTSKKLFLQLKNQKTFLSALMALEQFSKKNKIFVPTKFISLSPSKQQKQISTQIVNGVSLKGCQTPLSRLSLRYQIREKAQLGLKQEKKNIFYRRGASPLQLKRFSSECSIKYPEAPLVSEIMKISGGETSYTYRNNKVSRLQGTGRQGLLTANYQQKHPIRQRKKRSGWMQQSTYIMGDEGQNPEKSIKKKELCKSQVNPAPIIKISRKLSCSPQKRLNSPFKNTSRPNTKNQYLNQIQRSFMNDDGKNHSLRIQQVDEEKFRQEMSGAVLKNNGWVAKVSGLLDMSAKLEQSFHQGNQEIKTNRSIKLEKLQKIGKNQMLMSILNQQLGSIF